ncbi:MAG: ParB/RepB/Spo0J family partition protein [Lachnospiraceae bacterium]|nr:ParB/RepB/Spo0J family partition protein [Lachnospiraceae bacterium]
MSKGNSAEKIKLSSFDDLFEMSDEKKNMVEKKEIPLEELHEFKDHPFKVREDAKMLEMVESIKERGVLVPGICRIRPQGGYEIIAGHCRKRACEIVGLKSMPMFVYNLTDDEAVITMVDTNIQRDELLPSEKAKAYKMKYEAIKHQGKKGRSLEAIAETSGDSKTSVQRYIQLAKLTDELLNLVDEKKLQIGTAIDLSCLDTAEQVKVLAAAKKNSVTISAEQAEELKKASENGALNDEVIWAVLEPEAAPVKVKRVVFKSKKMDKRLDEFFPDNFTVQDIEELIISLLKKWKQEAEV